MKFACMYCSNYTQERKQLIKKTQLTSTRDTRSDLGIVCNKCGLFGCKVCLEELTSSLLAKKNSNEHRNIVKEDPWVREVSQYLENPSSYCSKNFTGSCCEMRLHKDAQPRCDTPSNLDGSPGDLDGALYLHEYGLLVDSPFDCVDILGLGAQPDSSGTNHCVIPPENASLLKRDNIKPLPFNTKDFECMSKKICLPHSPKSKKVSTIVSALSYFMRLYLLSNKYSVQN